MEVAMRLRGFTFSFALMFALFHSLLAHSADVPNIAAASDLQFALQEVATEFTKQTGRAVKLSFGSSGNYRRQIAEGAPFELFLSADEAYVSALAKEGKTVDDGMLYALGRIVFFVPKASSVKADIELKDLAAALQDGRLKKFAIANPEHAPYGRAAQQALAHAGLWTQIQPKLVLGENVSQAAQFATSGSTQGGIFAYAQASSPTIAAQGEFVLIPAEWHAPLRQRMVLMKSAGDTAHAFYRHLQSPPAREIFKRYGFRLPGEL
jgi:molybdate transport system substrate-binding protein